MQNLCSRFFHQLCPRETRKPLKGRDTGSRSTTVSVYTISRPSHRSLRSRNALLQASAAYTTTYGVLPRAELARSNTWRNEIKSGWFANRMLAMINRGASNVTSCGTNKKKKGINFLCYASFASLEFRRVANFTLPPHWVPSRVELN